MAAALVACVCSRQAKASPKLVESTSEGGAYVYASPGVVGFLLDEHRFAEGAHALWPVSFGAGMFVGHRSFVATLGAVLEYRLLPFESLDVHGMHALIESRIGGETGRVYGYGLVGFGFGRTVVDWSDYHEDYNGFVPQFGAGLQIAVVRGLFLGAEFDVDLGYYFVECTDCETVRDFWYHTGSIELLFGWRF